MNNVQRVLLTVYLPLTSFFLIADNLFPGEYLIKYIKFATILTLFFIALRIKKKYFEQQILTFAVFFALVGDFFLNFGSTLPNLKEIFEPLGMLGYFLAYLILIGVFQKRFTMRRAELFAALLVLAIYFPNFAKLAAFVKGPMFYGASLFGIVLCYMAWTSICTIFRGYFSVKVSYLMALSGSLIFISDLAVAHSLFNPAFKYQFVPWLENLIWASFVPAWTLIVVTMADKNVYPPQTMDPNN